MEEFLDDLLKQEMEENYIVGAVVSVVSPADFAARADRFAGVYRWTRSSSTTLEKYSTQLFATTVEVKNPGDGTLFITTPYGNMQLVEVERLNFRQVGGPFHFVFCEDDQGNISYMFTDMIPQFAFEKERWYETVGFNVPLLLVSLLMFLSMLLVALIRIILNRSMIGDPMLSSYRVRVAYQLIVGISVLNLLFAVGTLIWGQQIVFRIPLIYKFVIGLGVLSALLTVASVAFIWFLNFWNLLGWRY